MFGNIFGDFEKKQQEMLKKAEEIVVEQKIGGISVTVNGKKEIVNIAITDATLLTDKEQLEDLLITTLNRALEEAGNQAAEQTQKMMEQMLPPGMGDMFKGLGG
jgi:nucleoid-associated protein EbfC